MQKQKGLPVADTGCSVDYHHTIPSSRAGRSHSLGLLTPGSYRPRGQPSPAEIALLTMAVTPEGPGAP